jgi:hypothetical protein
VLLGCSTRVGEPQLSPRVTKSTRSDVHCRRGRGGGGGEVGGARKLVKCACVERTQRQTGPVVLKRRYNCVTVMLQWCYSGVTVVLQLCYSGVTVVL